MDEVTLNLVKFALDMHTAKQQVAAKNIARADFQTRFEVDFSQTLARLDSMTAEKQSEYLQVFNSNPENIEVLIKDTGKNISVESEHSDSTKAMLEYQALVEVLNRRLSIKAAVLGGQR